MYQSLGISGISCLVLLPSSNEKETEEHTV